MPRNDEFLNGIHYAFEQATPRTMGGSSHHKISAIGGPTASNLGSIMWHHKTGEIGNIAVSKEVQRRGLATDLLSQARSVSKATRGVKPPRHSMDRTKEGEQWARSLGERLPRSTKIRATAGDWMPA